MSEVGFKNIQFLVILPSLGGSGVELPIIEMFYSIQNGKEECGATLFISILEHFPCT